MSTDLPGYIERRIRQTPPEGVPVVPNSTPVIAFGDARFARTATVGLNPSDREFRDKTGELVGNSRRLETLTSLGVPRLSDASPSAVAKVFEGCNRYFNRNPYRAWFDQLEEVLKPLGHSYCTGSAVHLDLVQWATSGKWGELSPAIRKELLDRDVPFLREQMENEQIELILLNGKSVVESFQAFLCPALREIPVTVPHQQGTTRFFEGWLGGRTHVLGWSTNIQSARFDTTVLRRQIASQVKALHLRGA